MLFFIFYDSHGCQDTSWAQDSTIHRRSIIITMKVCLVEPPYSLPPSIVLLTKWRTMEDGFIRSPGEARCHQMLSRDLVDLAHVEFRIVALYSSRQKQGIRVDG